MLGLSGHTKKRVDKKQSLVRRTPRTGKCRRCGEAGHTGDDCSYRGCVEDITVLALTENVS